MVHISLRQIRFDWMTNEIFIRFTATGRSKKKSFMVEIILNIPTEKKMEQKS